MTSHTIPVLDTKDPSNPVNYITRHGVEGWPLLWTDEMTGTLRRTVLAYLSGTITDEQLPILIAYLIHWIHAPCWLEKFPFSEGLDPGMAKAIIVLRSASRELVTVDDVDGFILTASTFGIDPL